MWPTKPEAKTTTETRQPPQPDFHLPQVYIIHALRPLNLSKLWPRSSERLLLIALPQHNANFKFHSQRSRNQRQVFKPASTTAPPTLPPSVEAAYKIKCIALKKRMADIEEQNNGTRERIVRNERAIRKFRLERAILVNRLSDIINKNGMDIEGLPVISDDNSEGSSEGPPT
ncbi:MAG: hypothetical protein Q9197_003590, partial [Variospora fuerteventurae]